MGSATERKTDHSATRGQDLTEVKLAELKGRAHRLQVPSSVAHSGTTRGSLDKRTPGNVEEEGDEAMDKG